MSVAPGESVHRDHESQGLWGQTKPLNRGER